MRVRNKKKEEVEVVKQMLKQLGHWPRQ
jgi:hypothetical protein